MIRVPEVFSKQFCSNRCKKQHLRAVGQTKYSRYAFVENNISDSPKVPRAKFMESDRFFRFISKCKFGSFKNPLDYFRFSRLNLLVQTKKLISMSYGSLKEGVLKKQSMPNFPKNKHFLPPHLIRTRTQAMLFKGHPLFSLTESQWKLRKQHNQNFLIKGKPLQNKYQREQNEINPNEQDCEILSQCLQSGIQVVKLTI